MVIDERVNEIERWFVNRGVPHLVENDNDDTILDTWTRALPLLVAVYLLLGLNALDLDNWSLAQNLAAAVGVLDGAADAVVVSTFFLLGAGFALSRLPGFIRQENHYESWDDVAGYLPGTPAETIELPATGETRDPLRRRQRFNIGLIALFGQALQITLVVAALTAFFVLFGFLAIPAETMLNWTRLDAMEILASTGFGDRTLVLTEPLIRVSVFLGAFSGMYLTVVLTTDETYRTEFASDVGAEIRQILAVRTAYHVAQGTFAAPELGVGGDTGTS